jgi:heme/copper-type cytochrome/quinol oxidase subunit 4
MEQTQHHSSSEERFTNYAIGFVLLLVITGIYFCIKTNVG